MSRLKALRVKLFADGCELAVIARLAADPMIRGFTTNPTLLRKAGVADYEDFAQAMLALVAPRPVSLEVLADVWDEMEDQARTLASWGDNVYVKIPVTNSHGEFAGPLIGRLTQAGVKVNVTAVFTQYQVEELLPFLAPETPCNVSIFAGRIADTGRDPVPLVAHCLELLRVRPRAELIWASPRELLNIFQADAVGADIITVTTDLLGKLDLVGKDLSDFSLETVRMFVRDGALAGYSLAPRAGHPQR